MAGSNYKRIACAQCSAVFETTHKRAFCSDACKWRAKTLKRNPSAPTRPTKDKSCTCQHCGKTYENGRRGGTTGEGSKYCSRACAFADNAQSKRKNVDQDRNGPVSFIYASYCLGCAAPFVSRKKRAFCGDACRPSNKYISLAPTIKSCATCGKMFAPPKAKTRPTDFCGIDCKSAAQARQRRVAHSRRRAVIRSATVENVDPFKVFDRDKWVCQLCRMKTPKAKRGSYDDNAPELDHIIPLGAGGEHSYRNTQCACRRCNSKKSDRPMGQLQMF